MLPPPAFILCRTALRRRSSRHLDLALRGSLRCRTCRSGSGFHCLTTGRLPSQLRRCFVHRAQTVDAPRRRRWRIVPGLLGLLVIGCLDQGFRRCVTFWVIVLPLYAHYIWVDKVSHRKGAVEDEVRSAEFERLHARYSPIVKRATLWIRGFYLKAAQLVSVRDDYLPAIYLEWTKQLQDEVPMALSSQEAKGIISEELNLGPGGIDELLCDWSDQPIGSASIGQVYKARLKSSGEWVAIKVQVPKAEQIFRADIKCLQMFTYFALPWAYDNMVEIERTFQSEFDYVEESRNLEEIRANLLPTWSHKVYVPRPIPELCARRVLVMELLRGEKLVDAVRHRLKPLADRVGKTIEEYEAEQLEMLRTGRRQAESSKALRWRVTLLQWWRWLTRSEQEQPVDLGDIFETLMAVHGQQVFKDGCFNADPHPGNIMLLEDGKTIGLIDFGQVTRVPLAFRIKLARLVLALGRRCPAEVARMEREVGVKRRHYKEEVQYRMCSFWLDRDTPDVMQGLNVFDLLIWGDMQDGVISQPDGYYMSCRCSVTLRSLALGFGVRLSTCEHWRPYAEALLRDHGSS